MPSKQAWLDDTVKALSGSRTYVGKRVANTPGRLALNLDIDNTSLQTYYDRGKAIPATLRLARYAKARGVSIFFNTGRHVSKHDRSIRELRRAGFPVDGMCLKQRWETLSESKRRVSPVLREEGLQADRQRRQPAYGLHRRLLHACLQAAQLRRLAGLIRAGRPLSTGGTSGSSRPRCPDR